MSKLSKAGARVTQRVTPWFLEGAENKLSMKSALPFEKMILQVKEEDRYKTLKDWKFAVGDRVLITKGSKKGTITKIEQINSQSNSFYVSDTPTTTMVVPKVFWSADSAGYVAQIPVPLKRDELKLVATVEDEATGLDKDVIIHDFKFQGTYFSKDHQKEMPTRVVEYNGQTLYLPWPAPAKPVTRSAASNQDVNSERTFFVESALESPVPAEALNSVRNPKSKYHKGIFTQKLKNRFVGPQMPVSETKQKYWAELQAKRARGYDALSPEIAEFIGGRVKEHVEKEKSKYI